MPWSHIKFSELILKGNVWRSVWRICMLILGLNGLIHTQTPHYYGQFALSLGEESSYIFSKLNSLNTDTPLLRTLYTDPSVSVLTGFDCIDIPSCGQRPITDILHVVRFCCGFINGSSSCSIEYWFPVEAGPCQEGYYCPNGTLLPIPCPDNTMKNYTGGYGIVSDCTPCLAGKFCLNGNWLVIKGYSVLSLSLSSSPSSSSSSSSSFL